MEKSSNSAVPLPAFDWDDVREWHKEFDDPDDRRSTLSWRGRFAHLPSFTTVSNFHSSGDDVFTPYEGNASTTAGLIGGWETSEDDLTDDQLQTKPLFKDHFVTDLYTADKGPGSVARLIWQPVRGCLGRQRPALGRSPQSPNAPRANLRHGKDLGWMNLINLSIST